MSVFLLATVVAVPVGYLLGGRVRNIGRLRLRGLWLLWAAGAITVAPRLVAPHPLVGRAMALLSAGLLAAFLLVSAAGPDAWVRLGIGLVVLGWALNGLVTLVNGGMPVFPEVLENHPSRTERALDLHGAEHAVLSSSTKLRPLADVLPVPCLHRLWRDDHQRRCGGLSLGDVLLAAGVGLLEAYAMTRSTAQQRNPLLHRRMIGRG